jgi:general secretion pathway protein A
MYKDFYRLKKDPFEITPDPSFLFPAKSHNEALASLYYGVRRHKGFIVLTGEVGTGKTMLVRALLQLLSAANIAYAYVFNSLLEPLDFLYYIAGDFGLPAGGKSKSEILLMLSNFVISRHQRKLTTVLIVDEAHHLSEKVLEEIRLLTNLETPQNKLLQIVLVGQPELEEKLDSYQLRQLKQRIAVRASLSPLTIDETSGYVQARLRLAGSESANCQLFPDATVAILHRVSRGIPRLINTVCENALINSYSQKSPTVTPRMIEEVATDFRLNVLHAPPAPVREANLANEELWKAMQTLRQVYQKLQSQSAVSSLPMFDTRGTRRDEPII